jgi:HSP20 family protein
MTYNLPYPKEHPVYPGEYVPLPEKEALLAGLRIPGVDSAVKMPAVNMEELKDCFKIEILIPGAKREDIFTCIEDNVLSVVVLNNNCEQFNTGKLQIHEFDTECLQRHILLPANADAEFAKGEYKDGTLSIYISKTQEPSKTNTQRIMIY